VICDLSSGTLKKPAQVFMKFGDEVEIWKFSAWCLLMHTGNGYGVCTSLGWFFEFCYSLMFKELVGFMKELANN
jgi:hypothetical protein